jgi:hypothetical protein
VVEWLPGYFSKGGELMAYKDPEKQRDYQRQWQRQKRAAEVGGTTSCRTLNPEDIRTAQGLRDLLSDVITDVAAAEGDVFMKARLIGYLVAIGIKTVETADLEARITALEQVGELN